jgi:hypothetical protein
MNFKENSKLLVHIAVEIVVVSCIMLYITKKNNLLQDSIKVLLHKIEEQEATINKHTSVIIELTSNINVMSKNINDMQQVFQTKKPSNIVEQKSKRKHIIPTFVVQEKISKKPIFIDNRKIIDLDDDSSEQDSENLDDEIQSELDELEDN